MDLNVISRFDFEVCVLLERNIVVRLLPIQSYKDISIHLAVSVLNFRHSGKINIFPTGSIDLEHITIVVTFTGHIYK